MRTAADLDRFGGTRLDGWRILDAAKGVLVALRRCTLDEAFAEIVQTAKDHNAAPLELAHALVAVAANDSTADLNDSTVLTVDAAWGALLDAPRGRLGPG